ncbi:hypothetical protein LTR22_024556 [Elasticomyces elasticus]|nr:hypothetical protein LTR22_024556 [Elasticomyces elasticus]KAK4917425.1 hypothetical protein LTR49_014645 [Elasticomyces elasticus]KAK5738078.1 hypothetical protein LTS12_025707 [Elasticomyces elasticus]
MSSDCVSRRYLQYKLDYAGHSVTDCIYEDQVSQPQPTYHFVAETPGVPTGSRRRPEDAPEEPNDVTISAARLQTIETRIETLSNMVQVLQTQTSSGAASSAAHSTPGASTPPTSNEPGLPYDPLGHLPHGEDGRMRYVESAFWASICQEVSDLDGIVSGHNRCLERPKQDTSPDNDSEPGFDGHPWFHSKHRVSSEYNRPSSTACGPLPTLSHERLTDDNSLQAPSWTLKELVVTRTVARYPEFLRQLPSKRRCDALLDGYVRGYHIPIIHMPTFRKQYEEFWKTRNDVNAGQTASTSFAALLVAIMYAGSVACPEAVSSGAIGTPAPREAATHLHKLTMNALQLSDFPRTPTLDSFRAYIICQSTWAREEEPFNGSIHQPLHAIMILLIDLVQSSDTETAAASRRSVDVCFALCGPYGGIVSGGTGPDKLMERPLTEGGQKVWEYFRRLRIQAWQKAGLDPTVVWTREQAVQYCNKQAEPSSIIDQTGPTWSEGRAFGMKALDTTNTQPPAQMFEAGVASPPNIDWTYLDIVLEGHQQPDLGFDYDQ